MVWFWCFGLLVVVLWWSLFVCCSLVAGVLVRCHNLAVVAKRLCSKHDFVWLLLFVVVTITIMCRKKYKKK